MVSFSFPQLDEYYLAFSLEYLEKSWRDTGNVFIHEKI